MDKVLCVQIISVKSNHCIACNSILVNKKCSLAVYSGKKKNRNIKFFVDTELQYCTKCNYYYIKGADAKYIQEFTNYDLYLKTNPNYEPKSKINSSTTKPPISKPKYTNKKPKVPPGTIIGNEMFHENYGNGVITAFDGERLTVKFNKDPKEKRFNIYPQFMKLYKFDDAILSSFLNKLSKSVVKNKKPLFTSMCDLNINDFSQYNIVNDGKINYIYIHKTTRSFCSFKWDEIRNCRHNTEIRNVIVRSLSSGSDVNIGAEFCFDCKQYKIDEAGLNHYERKYGQLILMKKLVGEEFSGNLSGITADWEKSSALADLGYSVRANGLSRMERWILLEYIIDNKIMSATLVIMYIRQAIGIGNMNIIANREANQKREEDIDFIERKYIFGKNTVRGELVQVIK